MALLPQVANSDTNSEKMDDRSPLPAGDYLFVLKKAEFKQTKNKDGHYLNCTMAVAEGEHKGKVIWELFNLDNPNPVAVEIANKAFNSLCDAMGLEDVEDSDEIVGGEFAATLRVTEGDSNYPPRNEVTTYFPVDEYEAGDSEGIEEGYAGEESEEEEEVEAPKKSKKDKKDKKGKKGKKDKKAKKADKVEEEEEAPKGKKKGGKLPWE